MTEFWNFNIAEIGLLIVGAAYVFSFWKQGGNKASSDLIKIYEVKDREQRQLLADCQVKFDSINMEMGRLRGQVEEKDQKIKEYMQIFQGRSPEQEKYQGEMRQFTAQVAKYMAETLEILTALNTSIKGAK